MTNIDISRRALLGGLAASAIPTAVTATANATIERPNERVDRLAFELSDAMSDYLDGRFFASVYPSKRFPSFPVGYTRIDSLLDPSLRLSIKIAEIRRDWFDLHGSWPSVSNKCEDDVPFLLMWPGAQS